MGLHSNKNVYIFINIYIYFNSIPKDFLELEEYDTLLKIEDNNTNISERDDNDDIAIRMTNVSTDWKNVSIFYVNLDFTLILLFYIIENLKHINAINR